MTIFENARLFEAERQPRKLAEALRETGAALSASLDIDTVLDRLLDQLERIVPYDSANVMLVQDGWAHIARARGYERFSEATAREVASTSFKISETANLHRLVEARQPLVISDIKTYPGWLTGGVTDFIHSWAGAPVIVNEQVIAIFVLDKIQPNFYQAEHAERLALFAAQAGLALQNARLFEET